MEEGSLTLRDCLPENLFQLVPEAKPDNLGCAIYGKTPITATILKWIPEILIDSFNRMTAPNGVGLAVATCSMLLYGFEAVANSREKPFAPSSR